MNESRTASPAMSPANNGAPNTREAHTREHLGTPTTLPGEARRDISAALRGLLADVFALYLKTKNFHWHMSGTHFRDYHLLLDEHGVQLFAMTDPIAERARKIGGPRCARLAISPGNSGSGTTTPTTSIHMECWRSYVTTTLPSHRSCARRMWCARNTPMSRPRVCWRCGSTRPSGASGSCSR